MLVEVGAIEVNQAVRVIREMSRHPVYQYTETCLMAFVDQILEVVGLAVAAGRSE